MSRRFPGPPLAALLLLGGCSHAGSITRLSADYNKAFADVRNEQLLVNILRAAAREPLQFSSMGEINATVHRSAGIDTTLENIIAGGANAVSHTVSIEANNEPVISVTPLSNKEFIAGMLLPATPEALQQFMVRGWDAESILPLLVEEYQCPGGQKQINSGEGPTGEAIRRKLVETASRMEIEEVETEGDAVALSVADDKALEMLRSGVASGYTVVAVEPGTKPGMSVVRLRGPSKSEWVVRHLDLCSEGRSGDVPSVAFVGESSPAAERGTAGSLKLRSVEGIIHFLGEHLRSCYLANRPLDECALAFQKKGQAPHLLFRVSSGATKPYPVLIGTRFYDRNYWISRLDSGDVDRTAKTLSFINQLIALQTDASEIKTTPRVLPIGAR